MLREIAVGCRCTGQNQQAGNQNQKRHPGGELVSKLVEFRSPRFAPLQCIRDSSYDAVEARQGVLLVNRGCLRPLSGERELHDTVVGLAPGRCRSIESLYQPPLVAGFRVRPEIGDYSAVFFSKSEDGLGFLAGLPPRYHDVADPDK